MGSSWRLFIVVLYPNLLLLRVWPHWEDGHADTTLPGCIPIGRGEWTHPAWLYPHRKGRLDTDTQEMKGEAGVIFPHSHGAKVDSKLLWKDS